MARVSIFNGEGHERVEIDWLNDVSFSLHFCFTSSTRGVFIFETNAAKPYAMGSAGEGKFLWENYNPFDDDFDNNMIEWP